MEAGETRIDDKVAIEVELAAYAELQRLTATIRCSVEKCLNGSEVNLDRKKFGQAHLVFLDDALRSALDLAAGIELQLKNLGEAYKGAANTADGGLDPFPAPKKPFGVPQVRSFSILKSLSVPTAAADAAVALIGALRTDTRYSGRQVVIPEQAFALALAHEWEGSESVQFHYPTLFIPPTAERSKLMQEFVQAFDGVLEERRLASQKLSSLLAFVSGLQNGDALFPPAKASLDAARDQFQAAEAVFSDLSANLAKADDRTGLTQLQLLERAAFVRMVGAAKRGRTYYLFAQVVSAGGAFRVARNLFRMLFWSDGLEHCGGCVVTYGLFSEEGQLLASSTIGGRSGYEGSRAALRLSSSSARAGEEGG